MWNKQASSVAFSRFHLPPLEYMPTYYHFCLFYPAIIAASGKRKLPANFICPHFFTYQPKFCNVFTKKTKDFQFPVTFKFEIYTRMITPLLLLPAAWCHLLFQGKSLFVHDSLDSLSLIPSHEKACTLVECLYRHVIRTFPQVSWLVTDEVYWSVKVVNLYSKKGVCIEQPVWCISSSIVLRVELTFSKL